MKKETVLLYDEKIKATWGTGAWSGEVDLVRWVDKATGLPCVVYRTDMGSLCGYIGIKETLSTMYSLFYGLGYEDELLGEVRVHGGLTFSGKFNNVEEIYKDVWWFGFDCAHFMDIVPQLREMFLSRSGAKEGGTYKDIGYVTSEVESLALQFQKIAQDNEHPIG